MSNPRPDPPRLAAIRERQAQMRELACQHISATLEGRRGEADRIGAAFDEELHNCSDDVKALLAERDALLSDLRTLEAQWRTDGDHVMAYASRHSRIRAEGALKCADDLAALLARLEGA